MVDGICKGIFNPAHGFQYALEISDIIFPGLGMHAKIIVAHFSKDINHILNDSPHIRNNILCGIRENQRFISAGNLGHLSM